MIARTLSTSEKRAALHGVAGKLAEFCQALYPLLVAHADDSGRLQGDPFTVKHAVDPTSPRGLGDFERALSALHQVGLILRYEVEGRKFVEINHFAEYQPGLKNRGNSKIPPMSGDAAVCRSLPLEEKRTEEKRTEGKGTELVADAPPALAAVSADDPSPEITVQAVLKIWNDEVAPASGLPVCRALSAQRRGHILARLKAHGLADVREAMLRIRLSDFLCGRGGKDWRASFDWLMGSEVNFNKVLEGNYDSLASRSSPPIGNLPDAAATRAKYLSAS